MAAIRRWLRSDDGCECGQIGDAKEVAIAAVVCAFRSALSLGVRGRGGPGMGEGASQGWGIYRR